MLGVFGQPGQGLVGNAGATSVAGPSGARSITACIDKLCACGDGWDQQYREVSCTPSPNGMNPPPAQAGRSGAPGARLGGPGAFSPAAVGLADLASDSTGPVYFNGAAGGRLGAAGATCGCCAGDPGLSGPLTDLLREPFGGLGFLPATSTERRSCGGGAALTCCGEPGGAGGGLGFTPAPRPVVLPTGGTFGFWVLMEFEATR